MTFPTPVLTVQGLTFHYPHCELFTSMSFHILPGITLVRGGDGRGKSTLLRLMAVDVPAQSGELRLQGVALSEQPQAYQAHVFWADPRTTRFDQVTAEAYFAGLRPRYPQWDDALRAQLVAGLALEPHEDKPLYMLSTGSRRKVWLAAALASGAPLTLLDDPFAALDKPSIQFAIRTLAQLGAHPTRAIVLATFDAPPGLPLVGLIELGD